MKPDLSPLSCFHSLEEIHIEGQRKTIELVSQLESLKDVTLRSISAPDIIYLQPLRQMWSLDIKLGGIKDLCAIEGMDNTSANNMRLDDYLPLLHNPHLERVGVWFGSDKRNNRFAEIAREHTLEPWQALEEFEFA
jgi:hypothetical protein